MTRASLALLALLGAAIMILDGYDLQVIAVVVPLISEAWGILREFLRLGNDHAGVRPRLWRAADGTHWVTASAGASSSSWACCWCRWPWAQARW